jgi:hypothetical protein
MPPPAQSPMAGRLRLALRDAVCDERVETGMA